MFLDRLDLVVRPEEATEAPSQQGPEHSERTPNAGLAARGGGNEAGEEKEEGRHGTHREGLHEKEETRDDQGSIKHPDEWLDAGVGQMRASGGRERAVDGVLPHEGAEHDEDVDRKRRRQHRLDPRRDFRGGRGEEKENQWLHEHKRVDGTGAEEVRSARASLVAPDEKLRELNQQNKLPPYRKKSERVLLDISRSEPEHKGSQEKATHTR